MQRMLRINASIPSPHRSCTSSSVERAEINEEIPLPKKNHENKREKNEGFIFLECSRYVLTKKNRAQSNNKQEMRQGQPPSALKAWAIRVGTKVKK
jgi:hypothetical protein